MNTLIGLKIPLEAFMIMFLLHNEDQDFLVSYVKNVKKIPTEVFKDLVSRGYLINNSKDQDLFTIESIELTDKFKYEVLKVPKVKGITFDEAFEQLREHYPSKVVESMTGAVRRVQGDIERCKKLYVNIVNSNGVVDEEKHRLILQCIDLEKSELIKSKKLYYIKMLSTYLQQKGWDKFEDDVKTLVKKNGTIQSATEEGFQEDI